MVGGSSRVAVGFHLLVNSFDQFHLSLGRNRAIGIPFRRRYHSQKCVVALFNCRAGRVALGMGDAHILGVQVEILGIGIADFRPVSGSPRQLKDKGFNCPQGAVDGCFRQRLSGAGIPVSVKLPLEIYRLRYFELLKRLATRAAFQSQNRLGDFVDNCRINLFLSCQSADARVMRESLRTTRVKFRLLCRIAMYFAVYD